MRILLYTDVHWSQYSSILRKRGNKFSQRLENIIQSVNWVEDLATTRNCDKVVCLGDFFDKSELNAEEITSLKEIKWANLPHHFIVGNHESNVSGLVYSSTNSLANNNDFHIHYEPSTIEYDKYNITIIPYILEDDRKPLKEYLVDNGKHTIVLSHNDIAGMQFGNFLSKEGFTKEEIEKSNCLFLNGHLHNCGTLNDKETIINIGNLTGQNFSEDATKYEHFACILNIDDNGYSLEWVENPFAFNFYKVSINKEKDIYTQNFKSNAVITAKCEEALVQKLKDFYISKNIDNFRIVSFREDKEISDTLNEEISLASVDYLKQFADFILDKVGTSEVVQFELGKVVSE